MLFSWGVKLENGLSNPLEMSPKYLILKQPWLRFFKMRGRSLNKSFPGKEWVDN